MGGSDRALMLATPGLAVLAAFALPTLKAQRRRSDRLVLGLLLQPRRPRSVGDLPLDADRRAGQAAGQHRSHRSGFVPQLSVVALAVAALGTLAWLWLVRWRTSRHRHPLWKSLVLPASGVALAWLLTMTLLLPPLTTAAARARWWPWSTVTCRAAPVCARPA
jgi:hypothetical protein